MSLIQRVRSHLASPDSNHGKIAKGFFWVSLFLLVGKLAGAAKEIALAWRYGVTAEVDAYLFVLNLVSWPIAVWVSVLTWVLVPLSSRLRKGNLQALAGFRAELLGQSMLWCGGLLVLAFTGLPILLASAGLSEGVLRTSQDLLPVLIWLIPLGMLAGLHSIWMLAAARHSNTLLESIPALVILTTLLVFPGGGLTPLVWGTLVGGIVHLLILLLFAGVRRELEAPRFSRLSRHWPAFMQGFWVVLAGQLIISLVGLVDQFFAAQLGGGGIATMSYANRVLGLILSLCAIAVSRATLPVFSDVDEQDGRGMKKMAQRWAQLSFASGSMAVIFGWWLAPWVIELLFERGRFSPQDTESVAQAFRYGLFQLPFFAAGLIYVSWLTSRRKYLALLFINAGNLGVKLIASLVLMPWLGLNGLMLASGVMMMGSMLMLLWTCRMIRHEPRN